MLVGDSVKRRPNAPIFRTIFNRPLEYDDIFQKKKLLFYSYFRVNLHRHNFISSLNIKQTISQKIPLQVDTLRSGFRVIGALGCKQLWHLLKTNWRKEGGAKISSNQKIIDFQNTFFPQFCFGKFLNNSGKIDLYSHIVFRAH